MNMLGSAILQLSQSVTSAHSLAIGAGLALIVGILSSIGPCTATRLTWLASQTTQDARPWRTIVSFVAGTVSAYAAVGALGSVMFLWLFSFSPWIYAILGIISIVVGIRAVYNADHVHEAHSATSIGGAYLQGFGYALMIQPCCTPLIISVMVMIPNPLTAAALLAVYGIGHALPAFGTQSLSRWLLATTSAGVVVRSLLGALTIATGAYLMVLA